MLGSENRKEKNSRGKIELLMILLLLGSLLTCGDAYAKISTQKIFSSPQDAVNALIKAVKEADTKSLLAIFGPGSRHIVLSGDPVEDRKGREWFITRYEQKSRLEEETPGTFVLHVGEEEWPLPFPIVKAGNGWRFDIKAGREEIVARRIGRNELSAIQVCLAYVDAQKEYASRRAHQGEGLLEYAQRFVSEPGTEDGLYWETAEGQEQSPIGPLFAAAREEGYGEKPLGGKPAPYHGYLYRIIKAQGKNAPGGAHDYVVQGKMIGGFALIAYPAHYRASGVMTFIVNQDGVVYQKDLGKNTRSVARSMQAFDPDSTWTRAPE
ncbi:MAG TPA: DUF2950 domain-containing protein [Syntrophorhabdales bacterium]|nr:DUF2950 domain-containing protein [Syntrophorhabdales bacterium]